ncbi:hypothetical protein [Hymenobacter radiodurans]|uniref:hypothetical protein n=1 Tax=Hymenobacter radiodurans TaxID=2496028 RepID=UPI0010584EAF|nr:hypothetical protein [Hymenobacter radiodurans]
MKPSNNSLFSAANLTGWRTALVLGVSVLAGCGRDEPLAASGAKPEPVTVSGLPASADHLLQSPSRLVVSAQALVAPVGAGMADSIALTGYVAPDPGGSGR